MKTSLLICLLALTVGCACAQAPCYSSPAGAFWYSSGETYYINDNMATTNADQGTWEYEITGAHGTWNGVAGSTFWFSYGGTTGNNFSGTRQNMNIKGFQISADLTVKARTVYWYNAVTGGMVEVQMYFNQIDDIDWSDNPSATQWDIRSVALHEGGHDLSLNDEYAAGCSANAMYYGIKAGEIRRNLTADDEAAITWLYGGTTGVTRGTAEAVPKAYTLHQCYPNPFNPTTTIRYELPSESHVRLTVYNALGQEVARLVDGTEGAGYKTAVFDATRLASGFYYFRLEAHSTNDERAYTKVGKMALLK